MHPSVVLLPQVPIIRDYTKFVKYPKNWYWIPEWGIDTRYIKRPTSNGRAWTAKDDQKLRKMYPTAEAFELLNTFPRRSWMALRRRAEALAYEREVSNDVTIRSVYAQYSMQDIA